MRTRVANTGRREEDWIDLGPSHPIPCGPLGEHHTKGGVADVADTEATLFGHAFPVPGHRPQQMIGGNISIETSYDTKSA